MDTAAARDTLRRVFAPVARDADMDLEDVEVTPAGKRRLVRVIVDRDGGVSLDDIAVVSRALDRALDEDADADAALGGEPFVLEVSSPGVDRPLTEPRHWRRATGRLVTARLRTGAQVTGRLVGAADDAVTLDGQGGPMRLSLAEVTRGRVHVEFDRPDEGHRPGGADTSEPGREG